MPAYDLSAIAADAESRRRPGEVLVIAVDGPSGSGKSRLARRIGKALGPYTLVRMDHVVSGWDGLEESVRAIRPILEQLRSGSATSYRMWSWERGTWGDELFRPAAPTIALEGCGSGALALADLVDYLVWVGAPETVRHARAMARDGDAYDGHWTQWARQETEHYAQNRTRERADLRLDGRRPVR